jgi:hypothetical protein
MSLLVMIIGATTYAGLFGAFAVIIDSINEEERESRLMLNQSKKWAKLRGTSLENAARIVHYYTFVRGKSDNIEAHNSVANLPISLKTDISMVLYDELIRKVNLFDYGGPAFVMTMVRFLSPRLYMETDYIVR